MSIGYVSGFFSVEPLPSSQEVDEDRAARWPQPLTFDELDGADRWWEADGVGVREINLHWWKDLA